MVNYRFHCQENSGWKFVLQLDILVICLRNIFQTRCSGRNLVILITTGRWRPKEQESKASVRLYCYLSIAEVKHHGLATYRGFFWVYSSSEYDSSMCQAERAGAEADCSHLELLTESREGTGMV